jgi:hypothetical protein
MMQKRSNSRLWRTVDNRLKDAALAEISQRANVAQFISFSPGWKPAQRFSRIRGFEPDYRFESLKAAIEALMLVSPEKQLNVRSFRADDAANQKFEYGLPTVDSVVGHVHRLAASGLFTIVNERIDIHDGGVSGVLFGGLVEFSPEDTPRCVERPGTAALPMGLAMRVLKNAYGFTPQLEFCSERVEFSLHPMRRGWRHEHTIVWEIEHFDEIPLRREILWPNRFSEFIGDKAYGLLIADAVGLRVPYTIVIGRNLAPFSFGTKTSSSETWLRTCPRHQVPGRYPTYRGWRDPFELLAHEDPEGTILQSVLAQDSVDAFWAGALDTDANDEIIIEGVKGYGDRFMQGQQPPEPVVPSSVRTAIIDEYWMARETLGPMRMEWAYDGSEVWVLQLHVGRSKSVGRIVVEGEPARWERFEASLGLEALRAHLREPIWGEHGIILVGDVGVTSHFADVLRRSGVPSRIEPKS